MRDSSCPVKGTSWHDTHDKKRPKPFLFSHTFPAYRLFPIAAPLSSAYQPSCLTPFMLTNKLTQSLSHCCAWVVYCLRDQSVSDFYSCLNNQHFHYNNDSLTAQTDYLYPMYTVRPKKQDTLLMLITSRNINRFLKFFHGLTQHKIFFKIIITFCIKS